ncbi:MAG: helix-turn-helix domain-containing protein [Acidobacteriota bacterium]
MDKTEIRLMQEEIQASRPEEGRWRCPGALRQRVLETVEAYRAQGLSRKVLAKELGVSESTLLRWRRQSQAGFRPVRIKEEASGPTSLILVTPSGCRLEGLGASTAIEILRGLGC